MKNTPRELRRAFLAALIAGLKVTWPILSLLIGSIVALGIAIGVLEGWSMTEAVYFAFITSLTIGYGDLVPLTLFGRLLAVLDGICGVLLTALMAAVAVKALAATMDQPKD